jgi:hypothetical protein
MFLIIYRVNHDFLAIFANKCSIQLVQFFPADLLSLIPHATSLFYQHSGAEDRAGGDGLGKGEIDPTSSRLSSGNHVTTESCELPKVVASFGND